MGKTGLSIEYTNNRKVYAPGDVVEGTIQIELKKTKKLKRVRLTALGESGVKLKTDKKVQIRSNEKYFEYVFDVFQGSESELTAGNHNFPFRVQLKTGLPTSYEGNLGHVRYSIKAVVEYPGAFSGRTKCMSAFTVLDTVDLNFLPASRAPQRIFCELKASGCCFWRKQAVSIDLTTEKTGFVPGEFITVNGIIANGRSKAIRSFKIELQQKVTFYGRGKNEPVTSPMTAHNVLKSVATWNCKAVIPGEQTVTWSRKQLMQIPPLIPTGLQHCNLINVQYYLNVRAIVPGSVGGTPLTGKSSFLTVGTVPLMVTQPPPQMQNQAFATAPQLPAMHNMPTAPPAMDFVSEPPPPYEPGNAPHISVPLPSYEEAITGGTSLNRDLQNDQQANDEIISPDTMFTPQYAYYDFSQPAFNPTYQTN